MNFMQLVSKNLNVSLKSERRFVRKLRKAFHEFEAMFSDGRII